MYVLAFSFFPMSNLISRKESISPSTIGKIGLYTVFVTPPATPIPNYSRPVSMSPEKNPVLPPPVQLRCPSPQQFYYPTAAPCPSNDSISEFFRNAIVSVQNVVDLCFRPQICVECTRAQFPAGSHSSGEAHVDLQMGLLGNQHNGLSLSLKSLLVLNGDRIAQTILTKEADFVMSHSKLSQSRSLGSTLEWMNSGNPGARPGGGPQLVTAPVISLFL